MKPPVYSELKDYFFERYCTESANIPVHLHDMYEIFQSESETLNYFVEGTTYTLMPYDIIITNTNEIHRPIMTNPDLPYKRRFILFRPEAFMPFFNANYNPLSIFNNRKSGMNNHLILSKESQPLIDALFHKIQSHKNATDPSSNLLQKTAIVELLVFLEKQYTHLFSQNKQGHTLDHRVERTLQFINTHYKESMSLDHIAHHLYLDKFYLSHLFKENTGFTINEYLQTKRIKEVKTLIGEGMPIVEASEACGFNDYSNFYKTFKKLTHLSPSQFKGIVKH